MQNVPRQRGPTISIRAKEKRGKRIDIIKKWKNNNNKLQNGSIYPKEPAEKKKKEKKNFLLSRKVKGIGREKRGLWHPRKRIARGRRPFRGR